jgi:hypothetical protein
MNPAEKYILDQKEPFKSILLQLQIVIESEVAELELKYKWRIPYYYLHGSPFCFLNVSKGYVDVGFRALDYFSDLDGFLISEKRKVMKSLRYTSVEEIQPEILAQVLQRLKKLHHKGFYGNG